MLFNQVYYTGDVSPENGGIFYRKLENGTIEAWETGEYSPISYANYLCDVTFKREDELTDQEEIENAFFECDIERDFEYNPFYWMKAIDREYTNESNLGIIDKFVRYDYNIWQLIGKRIGLTKGQTIITYNGIHKIK